MIETITRSNYREFYRRRKCSNEMMRQSVKGRFYSLKIDFITKQIEKKTGMDLNGDGVIGSGTRELLC